MARMKIYEIAKSLNTKSSDLIKVLTDNGFEAKSHNSNIEDDAIAFILKTYSNKPQVETKQVEEEKQKVTEEPVIVTQSIEPEKQQTVIDKPNSNPSNEKRFNKPEQKSFNRNNEQTKYTHQTDSRRTTNDSSYVSRNSNTGNNNTGNSNYANRNTNNQTSGNNNYANRNTGNTGNNYANRNTGNTGNNYANRNTGNTGNNNYANRNNGNTGNTGNNYNNRNTGNSNYVNRNNNANTGNNSNYNSGNNSHSSNSGINIPQNNTSLNSNTRNNTRNNSFNKDKERDNLRNNYKDNNFNKNRNKNNKQNIDTPKKDPNRKGAFIMPKPVVVQEEPSDGIRTVILPEVMTIKELADKMKIQPAALVKKLFLAGKMVSINHEITFEEAEEIALEYNIIAELEEKINVIEELLKEDEEDETKFKKRPPVVCVMGHVDHGKTSLLDAIRETHVTDREAGGITQHIGAYMVSVGDESITFLDTPGHEAFTSMRMRGAQSTDIAILVVAADDGVMPQTIEAISHAKAAGVEIIVAINKVDKPSANIERVKQELVEYELIAEDWGGSTVFVPVSAHTGEGIEQLLEMIILTSEVCELKANPDRLARGIVIEAQLDKHRGPVATILVQKGTLNIGDSIVIGSAYGKVRAMMDDKGRRVKEAKPSTPVEILGLNEVPDAGEIFMVTENDKEARSIAETYIKQGREKLLEDTKAKLSLDGLFSQIQAGNIKELNLIIKADVQGSVEAVKQSLLKLSNDEVAIRVIHGGVGAINESDVSLASASNAIIIGFNVRPDTTAKETADREKVDLRLYRVIYNAIEDIEAAMKGMLDPVFEEKVIGHAEVRQVFKASGLGTIAGSYVLDGKIVRNCFARINRGDEMIYEGSLASLKRFKDDVKEVASGYECGLVFEKFNDVKEEDRVELYIMEEVPR